MEGEGRSWLRGCGIGCGALMVIAVLLAVGGVVSIMKPLGEAIDIRSELDTRFGEQCSYVPPIDGVVTADRIEAFLQVRDALAASCRTIERRSSAMRRLEQLDDDTEVSKAEVMALAGKATLGAVGLGPALGDLYEVRNRALLDAGMGLGEYSYIYLTAYRRQLTDVGPRTGMMDGSPVNRRIHTCLEDMLKGQLAAARGGGVEPSLLSELAAELAAMAVDPQHLPWHQGLSPAMGAAFEPYRDRLDSSFCAAATELELLRGTRRFLAIESE